MGQRPGGVWVHLGEGGGWAALPAECSRAQCRHAHTPRPIATAMLHGNSNPHHPAVLRIQRARDPPHLTPGVTEHWGWGSALSPPSFAAAGPPHVQCCFALAPLPSCRKPLLMAACKASVLPASPAFKQHHQNEAVNFPAISYSENISSSRKPRPAGLIKSSN